MLDASTSAVSRPPGLTLRSVLACNLGVCLEGFDFIAYSAFSVIIAKLYFPTGDAFSSALFALGALGIAYIVRPFGGIFWGIFADRRGRRPALSSISIVMAVGTALVAFAPPYRMIGIAAPIIMLIARVIQGFAASGEFASATSMLVELAPRRRRSFFASTQMASQVVTVALASAVVLALSVSLDQTALESWGWRSVFVVGTLIGPLGFYMRARMAESPEFVEIAHRPVSDGMTLAEALARYPSELLCLAGLVVIGAASFYLILIFMPIYAARELGISIAQAQIATIAAALVQGPVILLSGALADRYGQAKILLPASLAYAVLAYPLFSYLISAPSFWALMIVQLVSSVILGFLSGPLPAAMSELLPAEVRSSGIGIVYNIVGAVFGGLGPFLIMLIVGITGDKAGPAYWAAFTGLIGVLAVTALWRGAPAVARGAA